MENDRVGDKQDKMREEEVVDVQRKGMVKDIEDTRVDREEVVVQEEVGEEVVVEEEVGKEVVVQVLREDRGKEESTVQVVDKEVNKAVDWVEDNMTDSTASNISLEEVEVEGSRGNSNEQEILLGMDK